MNLEIRNLHVSVEGKEILKGVNLSVREKELRVLMGPNGSGKTSLSRAIMGHPKYKVTEGDILLDGNSILGMSTDKRAQAGIFVGFQNPVEIEGLGLISFITNAKAALEKGKQIEFRSLMNEVKERSERLRLSEEIMGRSLNHGFSGGEKKKLEILQMQLFKPKIAILDEPDSGLDVDAVKALAEGIEEFRKETNAGILLITHYTRILNYMSPQNVDVLVNGRIEKSGGPSLAEEIEKKGYGAVI
ncbi:MAG: Fe-S cluster assembly ATPase SufC [Candidatus Micrarchaeaceae archaeon]